MKETSQLCEMRGCQRNAGYAIYQFRIVGNSDCFTKRWIHVCGQHDQIIAEQNYSLRTEHPDVVWAET